MQVKKYLFFITYLFSLWIFNCCALNNKTILTVQTVCAACHGLDGNKTRDNQTPKLSGQNVKYFIQRMRDFRLIKNQIMTPIAIALNDQEIFNLAIYYANFPRQVESIAPNQVRLGQQIYLGGLLKKGVPACAACHDPQGFGNPLAGFPRLNGQHADYHRMQLFAFRAKSRQDRRLIMQTVAAPLSDREIDALAHYLSGLY